MNKLLEKVIQSRKGHYCHCIEVSTTYEMEGIAESIMDEFEQDFDKETIIEFLESMTVYCLDNDNEKSVYDFSFREYIESL